MIEEVAWEEFFHNDKKRWLKKLPEKSSYTMKDDWKSCLRSFQSLLHLPNRCLHWPAGSMAPQRPDISNHVHHQHHHAHHHNHHAHNPHHQHHDDDDDDDDAAHLWLPLSFTPRLPTVRRASHTSIQSSSSSSWSKWVKMIINYDTWIQPSSSSSSSKWLKMIINYDTWIYSSSLSSCLDCFIFVEWSRERSW